MSGGWKLVKAVLEFFTLITLIYYTILYHRGSVLSVLKEMWRWICGIGKK